MNKKELPIGTVVMLVGGSKKVMITGYRSKNADADKVFDYNGCVFPEGLMENIYCLFALIFYEFCPARFAHQFPQFRFAPYPQH